MLISSAARAVWRFSIHVELQHAKQQVWLRLEGALSAQAAEASAHRNHESLTRSKSRLVLDCNELHLNRTTDSEPLRTKLANYNSRIRVLLPKLSPAHPRSSCSPAYFISTEDKAHVVWIALKN